MIEKVTLQLTGDSKLVPENGPDCGEMNPKTLLLYAAAKCSGMTALMIMEKERLRPKRFEISVSGELSTEEVRSESVFKSLLRGRGCVPLVSMATNLPAACSLSTSDAVSCKDGSPPVITTCRPA